MKILDCHRSKKSRRFHIRIVGDSLNECIEFSEQLRKLPSVKCDTITTKFTIKGNTVGFISCKSLNYRRFNNELKELINKY